MDLAGSPAVLRIAYGAWRCTLSADSLLEEQDSIDVLFPEL